MIDYLLATNRDANAAKRFFKKVLTSVLSSPDKPLQRVITVDKNAAYPPAIQQLMKEKAISKETMIRQTKCFNNNVEQIVYL